MATRLVAKTMSSSRRTSSAGRPLCRKCTAIMAPAAKERQVRPRATSGEIGHCMCRVMAPATISDPKIRTIQRPHVVDWRCWIGFGVAIAPRMKWLRGEPKWGRLGASASARGAAALFARLFVKRVVLQVAEQAGLLNLLIESLDSTIKRFSGVNGNVDQDVILLSAGYLHLRNGPNPNRPEQADRRSAPDCERLHCGPQAPRRPR